LCHICTADIFRLFKPQACVIKVFWGFCCVHIVTYQGLSCGNVRIPKELENEIRLQLLVMPNVNWP